MIIQSAIPVLVFEAQRTTLVILSNTGANSINVAFDYSTCATGDGFPVAAGTTTTQFQLAPGQKIWAAVPGAASTLTVSSS